MSFKKKALSSSIWTMSSSLMNKIVTLVVYTVIARFVTIEEFGYVAFSLLFIEFLSLFIGTGVRELLISKKNWNDKFASASFWLSSAIAIVVVLIIVFIAVPLATYLYTQQLADILMAMCFIPFFTALNCVQNAKLQRDLLYKPLSILRMFATLVAGMWGVYLAINDYGAWSLVYSKLLQAVIVTILLWKYSKFFPSLIFNKKYYQELYQYSLPLLGTESLNYWYPRAADLITSLFLGPAAYALIDVGRKVIMSLYQIMLKPLQTISFSIISRAKRDKKNQAYINLSSLISLVVCPVVLVLGYHAEYLITLLFGEKWLVSAEVMRLYSYAVFAICSFWFSGALFLSHNKAKIYFYINLFSMLSMIITALLTVQYGLNTLVLGQVIAEYVLSAIKLVIMVYTLEFAYKYFLRYQLSLLLIGTINSFLFYSYGSVNFTSSIDFFFSLLWWFFVYYLLLLILDRKYIILCYRMIFSDKDFT